MPSPEQPKRNLKWISSLHGWLLAAILAAALLIRLATVHFGLPALLDPDELMFELGAFRMIDGGQLNPEWFGHPATTTMYLLAIIDIGVLGFGLLNGQFADLAAFATAIYSNPGLVVLPHRIAISIIAVIGIWLTWRLASRMFDPATALVAAAILAVSPVHIIYSQIIRSDMMATVFMLGAMLFALTYARTGSWRSFAGTAVLLALAITTKWPYAVTGLCLPGALFLRWRGGLMPARAALVRLIQGGAAILLSIVVISPFLIIEFATVVVNLQGEAQVRHLGASGGSPPFNLWWYLSGPMFDALGPVALVLALGAFALRDIRREFVAICGIPGMAMLALISSQNIVWERWVLSLVPLAAFLAALTLVRIARMLARSRAKAIAGAGFGLMLGSIMVPLALAARDDGIERMNDTRRLASKWILANTPPDSTVLVEHFAFDLADSSHRILFPMGEAGCLDSRRLLAGKIDNSSIEAIRGGRSNLDIGTVAPERIASCDFDYVILAEYLRYAAEREHFPDEYRNYRRLIASGQIVARFEVEQGVAGGRASTLILRRNVPQSGATRP